MIGVLMLSVSLVVKVVSANVAGLGQACNRHSDCDAFNYPENTMYCRRVNGGQAGCEYVPTGYARDPQNVNGLNCNFGTSAVCGMLQCGPGTYGIHFSCPSTSCGHATYENIKWAPSQCTICGGNSFANGAANEDCECPGTGYEAHADRTRAQKCPLGYYNDIPKSMWNETVICATCQKCYPGKYAKNEGSHSCENPTFGHYTKDGTSHDECEPGTYSNTSKVPVTACKLCPVGYFEGAKAGTQCDIAVEGRYAAFETRDGVRYFVRDEPCPIGKYNDQKAQTECKTCEQGMYQNQPNNQKCEFPPKGHFSITPDKYEECVEGTYSELVGQKVSSCKVCQAGWFEKGKSGDACEQADRGRYAVEAAANSAPYRESSHWLPAGVKLYIDDAPCEPGRYNDKLGQTECFLCPQGQFAPFNGSTACDCASSGYTVDASRTREVACPKGKYTADIPDRMSKFCYDKALADFAANGNPDNLKPSTGNWECTNCEVGKFGEHRHSDNCTLCAEGKYQDRTGQTACVKCPTNSYTDTMGEPGCKFCAIWEFAEVEGSTRCQHCFTAEAGFGFKHPSQCIVIWFLLVALILIIVLIIVAKYFNACAKCCGGKCDSVGENGRNTIIVYRDGGDCSDGKKRRKKRNKGNYGSDSDSDDIEMAQVVVKKEIHIKKEFPEIPPKRNKKKKLQKEDYNDGPGYDSD